jgi:glycine cleavage system H protein
MAEYKGFRIPEELHYDLDYHVWLREEGELVVVGATDPAQASAGDIIHITVKKPGTRLARGAILATIESAKYMGPMRCPVNGTVEAVNEAVLKSPVTINRDAYGTWVARVRPEKLAEDMGALTPGAVAAARYKPIIDKWGITSKSA